MRFSALSALAVSVPLIVSGAEAFFSLAADEGAAPRRDVTDAPRESRPQPRPRTPSAQRPATAPAASDAPRPQEPRPTAEKLCLIPRAERPAAAPFPRDLEWIRTSGTPPVDAMRGKVSLVEVWESSCINCLRNLPVLSQLHRRYSAFGLVVLGIHSSEFSFTASRAAVERAVRRFGLDFPIASDSRKTFWNKWEVPGWPTTYLVDDRGMLASMHPGELTASTMEKGVRTLLIERTPSLRFPDPPTPSQDPYAPECGFVTPDIFTTPSKDYLLNTDNGRRRDTVVYADPGPSRTEGTCYLRGPWAWLEDGLERGVGIATASIGITYRAKEVYAILVNTGASPQDVEIRQDGRPLLDGTRGRDVDLTPDGRTIVRLGESRLYYLVVNSDLGRHDLELFPSATGFQVHSFSFGNRCQTSFPHK